MTISPSATLNTALDYKLNSPAYFPEKLILRNQLLAEVRQLQSHAKKVIAIEARAGSGKTVFAQQYLQQSKYPAGWYQIGREDHDPVALLQNLLALFQQNLPGFQSQNLVAAFEQGSIHYRESVNFSMLLAQEIAESTASGFQLVLDDLHLLDGAVDSIALITTLIRETPPWIQWILISRHSVKQVMQTSQIGNSTLIVGNDELDFNLEETAELLRHVFEISLPVEQTRQFHRQTEGWVTGLVLCAMQSIRKRRIGGRNKANINFNLSRHNFADYFLHDALADFSEKEVGEILRMVLLDDLPHALLNQLFGRQRTASIVKKMELSNRFFRCLDYEDRIYSFHHLFRESLLPIAIDRLSAEDRISTGLQAARFHIENDEPLKALDYVLKNEDMQMAENILQDFGLELLHRNRIKTLRRILENISHQILQEHPWLSFYYGACLHDSEPVKAYPFLTNAQEIFSEQNNQIGLLVTNSQLIEYHTIIDGHFSRMAKYVEELDDIFSKNFDELPPPLKMRIAYSLAMGFCFLQTDMEKVKNYDTLVLEMSLENGLDNMSAMARIIRVYRFSFVGNWAGAKEELEESFSFLTNPRVTVLSKLFIRFAQINLLEMVGDFENYRHQRHRLETIAKNDAIAQSVIRPFIYILNIDSALAENSVKAAERFTQEALKEQYAASGPHMRSQYLHYHALILSLMKKKDEALAALHESLQLRDETGGNSFRLLNHTIIGKAYAFLGMVEEAEEQFDIALHISDHLGEEFQRAAIFACRAWLRLQTGDNADALQDAKMCFNLMKKNDYRHFFAFMPDSMLPVLKLAYDNNIEIDFINQLLFKQLHMGVSKRGNFVRLFDIRLLSDWSIVNHNGCHISLNDFNKNEITMLFCLIEEPDNIIDRSILSERLWPNKNESKQRTSLDVLLLGLRKKLAHLAAPLDPKEYLSVDQGKIKLRHCRIDVLQFLEYERQANKHLKEKRIWQAGNSYNSAFNLWGKMGMKGLQWGGLLPAIVENKYIQAAKDWGNMLEKQEQKEDVRRLLENAFRQFPFDLELARQLYDFYANSQNPVAAGKVVGSYRDALLDIGYSSNEINSEEFSFWK